MLGLLTAVVVAAAILGARRIGRLNQKVEDLGRRNEELVAQSAKPPQPAQAEEEKPPSPSGVEEHDLTATPPTAPAPDTPPQATAEVTPAAAPPLAAQLTPPVAPEATPVVSLQDERGVVGLDGSGNLLGLDGVPPAEAKAIAAALQHGSLELPDDLKALSTIPKSIPIDDTMAGMPLVSCAATCVRATRPTLAWQAVEGAQEYTIVLFNQQGRPLYYGGPTGETSWTPPAPLQRGVTYTWRVAAYRPGAGAGSGSAPPASEKLAGAASRFRVIDAASATALERALRAAPGSRVAAGVLYARAGLLDDAGREFRALLTRNPDSGLAKALLAGIEAARLP